MRLLRIPEPFDHPDWLYEVRFDGPAQSCTSADIVPARSRVVDLARYSWRDTRALALEVEDRNAAASSSNEYVNNETVSSYVVDDTDVRFEDGARFKDDAATVRMDVEPDGTRFSVSQ
jgi:hypothetical protein